MAFYAEVRRCVYVEGLSERAAARRIGLARETVRKMLRYRTWTNTDGLPQHDIAQDGRFLMTKPVVEPDSDAASPPRINVVLNWFQELKERVPVP